jgi:hypothetical protein
VTRERNAPGFGYTLDGIVSFGPRTSLKIPSVVDEAVDDRAVNADAARNGERRVAEVIRTFEPVVHEYRSHTIRAKCLHGGPHEYGRVSSPAKSDETVVV